MAISHLSSPLIEGLSAAQIILDLPSSVKELLENSLDSSATDIVISFWDQGYHSFQLQDNGHGMAMDDLQKCALRNHTSKIELYSQVIQNTSETFGFRGEALYGLSKLSESVVITTKREAATAKLTISNYGKERSLSALDANQQSAPLRHSESGTILTVTSLLSGLSVRRKDFLRTKAHQFTKTIDLISQYSISNPSVSFTVRHFSGFNDSCSCSCNDDAGAGICNEKGCCITEKRSSKNTNKSSSTTILSLPKCATNDVWKRYQMLKKERMTCHTFTSLMDPSHNTEEDPFTYKCFWTFSGSSVRHGGSASCKTSSKRPSIFLNQKPIVNPKITKTLSRMAQENGLAGLFFILLIESSTKKDVLVDFNIKKDKSVMRSSFDQCLLDSLCRSFSSSISEECNLGERRVLTSVGNPNKASSGISGGLASVISTDEMMSKTDETKKLKEKTTTTTTTTTTTIPSPLARDVLLKKDDFVRMKVIGQFNHGFILTSLEGSTYIIDQHASDERRRLEELENALSFRVQRLIEPIPIDEWMLGRTDFLQSNGFVIEGSSLVGLPLIDGINLLLTKDDMMELVERERECGSGAMLDGGGNACLWELQSVHCRLASKACRSAIMIGDHLSPKEQEQVVRGLSGLRKPWVFFLLLGLFLY